MLKLCSILFLSSQNLLSAKPSAKSSVELSNTKQETERFFERTFQFSESDVYGLQKSDGIPFIINYDDGQYNKFMKFEEEGKEIKIFEKLGDNYLICGDFKRTDETEICWEGDEICFRCEVIQSNADGLDTSLYKFPITKIESIGMWNTHVLSKIVEITEVDTSELGTKASEIEPKTTKSYNVYMLYHNESLTDSELYPRRLDRLVIKQNGKQFSHKLQRAPYQFETRKPDRFYAIDGKQNNDKNKDQHNHQNNKLTLVYSKGNNFQAFTLPKNATFGYNENLIIDYFYEVANSTTLLTEKRCGVPAQLVSWNLDDENNVFSGVFSRSDSISKQVFCEFLLSELNPGVDLKPAAVDFPDIDFKSFGIKPEQLVESDELRGKLRESIEILSGSKVSGYTIDVTDPQQVFALMASFDLCFLIKIDFGLEKPEIRLGSDKFVGNFCDKNREVTKITKYRENYLVQKLNDSGTSFVTVPLGNISDCKMYSEYCCELTRPSDLTSANRNLLVANENFNDTLCTMTRLFDFDGFDLCEHVCFVEEDTGAFTTILIIFVVILLAMIIGALAARLIYEIEVNRVKGTIILFHDNFNIKVKDENSEDVVLREKIRAFSILPKHDGIVPNKWPRDNPIGTADNWLVPDVFEPTDVNLTWWNGVMNVGHEISSGGEKSGAIKWLKAKYKNSHKKANSMVRIQKSCLQGAKTVSILKDNELMFLFNQNSILQNVKHKNIANLLYCYAGSYDTSTEVKNVFSITESSDVNLVGYAEKLKSEIFDKTDKKEAVKEAGLEFARQIFEGLKYLHTKSVVHGNIRPCHILVCGMDQKEQVFKITDFGQFPQYEKGNAMPYNIENNEIDSVSLCQKNKVYGPPEQQFENTNIAMNEKIDIWSAGMCVHYLISFGEEIKFFEKRGHQLENCEEKYDTISNRYQSQVSLANIDLVNKQTISRKNSKTSKNVSIPFTKHTSRWKLEASFQHSYKHLGQQKMNEFVKILTPKSLRDKASEWLSECVDTIQPYEPDYTIYDINFLLDRCCFIIDPRMRYSAEEILKVIDTLNQTPRRKSTLRKMESHEHEPLINLNPKITNSDAKNQILFSDHFCYGRPYVHKTKQSKSWALYYPIMTSKTKLDRLRNSIKQQHLNEHESSKSTDIIECWFDLKKHNKNNSFESTKSEPFTPAFIRMVSNQISTPTASDTYYTTVLRQLHPRNREEKHSPNSITTTNFPAELSNDFNTETTESDENSRKYLKNSVHELLLGYTISDSHREVFSVLKSHNTEIYNDILKKKIKFMQDSTFEKLNSDLENKNFIDLINFRKLENHGPSSSHLTKEHKERVKKLEEYTEEIVTIAWNEGKRDLHVKFSWNPETKGFHLVPEVNIFDYVVNFQERLQLFDYRESITQDYFEKNPHALRRIMFKTVLQSFDDTICFRQQINSFWYQVGKCLTEILQNDEQLAIRIDQAINVDRGYSAKSWKFKRFKNRGNIDTKTKQVLDMVGMKRPEHLERQYHKLIPKHPQYLKKKYFSKFYEMLDKNYQKDWNLKIEVSYLYKLIIAVDDQLVDDDNFLEKDLFCQRLNQEIPFLMDHILDSLFEFHDERDPQMMYDKMGVAREGNSKKEAILRHLVPFYFGYKKPLVKETPISSVPVQGGMSGKLKIMHHGAESVVQSEYESDTDVEELTGLQRLQSAI